MPANYTLLEKITVGSAGASSVTFSSIPQTGYTDLVVKASVRFTGTTDWFYGSFNGDATSFTARYLQGNGSTAFSGTITNHFGLGGKSSYTANTFSSTEIYIPNYTSSNYKSISTESVQENNATTVATHFHAQLWSNTAAITSITLAPSGDTFAQYSTFYLYGVAKLGTTPAIVPYATGGDTIMTDGTYWYHTFVSSGTFTPQKALSVDYLVVAGGGGGGGGHGGGGGAGGFKTATGFSCASGTGLTVTIGAGGAGGAGNPSTVAGTAGSNSVFSSITSSGGGGGASANTSAASGGGGGSGSGGSGGSALSGSQGNAGGSGAAAAGGGGGGAGVAGTNAPSTYNGGAGGNGTANSYSGSSVTYAGGGGGAGGVSGSGGVGAAGGTGGGGAGGNPSEPNDGTAGTANRGGGGGGGGYINEADRGAGGNGGSGIVLVRYAV